MNESHYGGVAVEQVILGVITFSEDEIPSHNPITSYLPVSKKAKEGDAREEFPKGICFKVLLGFVMLVSPAHTRKHKTKAVVFRNVGGLEALHCSFGCPLVDDILI